MQNRLTFIYEMPKLAMRVTKRTLLKPENIMMTVQNNSKKPSTIDSFADFDDDLPEGPVSITRNASRFEKRTPTDRAEVLYSESCPKCGGKGRIAVYGHRDAGVCYQCDGKGVLTFKTPKAKRDANKVKSADRKERKLQDNLATFEAAHPDIAAWWTGSDFPFAISLREAVQRFGSLTDRQLAAAKKAIASLAERKAAREADAATRAQNAVAVDVTPIAEAFEKAHNKGIKRPKMRMAAGDTKLEFSRAPDHGANAGALYIKEKENDTYLGKVMNGKFFRSRDCSDDLERGIIDVCASPDTAAKAYGLRFGECSICGRELTDPVSVERGIGPICADNFGF